MSNDSLSQNVSRNTNLYAIQTAIALKETTALTQMAKKIKAIEESMSLVDDTAKNESLCLSKRIIGLCVLSHRRAGVEPQERDPRRFRACTKRWTSARHNLSRN